MIEIANERGGARRWEEQVKSTTKLAVRNPAATTDEDQMRQATRKTTRDVWRLAAMALTGMLLLGGTACSDDDASDTATGDETTTTTAPSEDNVIEVTGADFKFEGIPATVPAGSRFSLTTAEGGEPHELMIAQIPEDETRSAAELMALPMEELETLFTDESVALVTIAMPGTTDNPGGVAPEGGDGSITEPGRYLYLCTFPQGTTTDDVANATGPLEGEGTPHFMLGMVGEFTVE